ncbi:MAG TPA: hypothetical protein VGN97_10195 [Mesorhizobium sp.]|jgi:hypothetical protein|nr:hypothetical protein [Mesorhizobium sp.]
MRVKAKLENRAAIGRMKKRAQILAGGKWKREANRGVIDAGRKTKTAVQRAVHQQMNTKSVQFVSRSTRGVGKPGELAYEIFSPIGGQRVELYKGLRSVKSGKLAADPDAGTVRSAVWNAPRVFQRSFAANGGYFATLPGGGSTVAPRMLWSYGAKHDQSRDAGGRFLSSGKLYGPVRRLAGPSLREELGKG